MQTGKSSYKGATALPRKSPRPRKTNMTCHRRAHKPQYRAQPRFPCKWPPLTKHTLHRPRTPSTNHQRAECSPEMAGHRRRRPADQKHALPDQEEHPENKRRHKPDTQSIRAVIPLLAALGLVTASKKNMISITVEK